MLTATTHLRPVNAIPADAQAASTVNGTGFSRIGFTSAAFILSLGTLGAAATVDVKVQESDVLGSGYADITGAVFTQKVKATDDGKIYGGHIDLRGRKKFLRVVGTVGTAASEYAVVCLLFNAERDTFISAAQAGSEALAAASYDFTVSP